MVALRTVKWWRQDGETVALSLYIYPVVIPLVNPVGCAHARDFFHRQGKTRYESQLSQSGFFCP